jgi:hypothetical protein
VDGDEALDLPGDDPVSVVTTAGVGGKDPCEPLGRGALGEPHAPLAGRVPQQQRERTLTARWDSNLGSDGSEAVRADSSGNTVYGLGDCCSSPR